jgi:DNA primase
MVWDQLETGLVNPAGIVNHFINDEEEYKTVAGLFNTRLRGTMTREEQEKAFTETVYRVKKNSLDQKSRSASDMSVLQELIKEQAALNALHITFD